MHAGCLLACRQPHPTHGRLGGRQLYGIAAFRVRGPRTLTVVEDCAEAARSSDARDKYFAASVPGASVSVNARLAGELPALEVRHLPRAAMCVCACACACACVCACCRVDAARGCGRPPSRRWRVRLRLSTWQWHACQHAQLPPCHLVPLTRRQCCKAR